MGCLIVVIENNFFVLHKEKIVITSLVKETVFSVLKMVVCKERLIFVYYSKDQLKTIIKNYFSEQFSRILTKQVI